jgi:hypothetical protein
MFITAGCAPADGGPTSTSSSSATSTAVPSTAVPSDPVLSTEGDAQDNLAYFDFVMGALVAESPAPDGRTIVDHLVAAGFDKAAMEVTADATAVGGPVDAIVVAIRFDSSEGDATCIIGQTGNVGFHSLTAAALDTGRCLVGLTRTIDW